MNFQRSVRIKCVCERERESSFLPYFHLFFLRFFFRLFAFFFLCFCRSGCLCLCDALAMNTHTHTWTRSHMFAYTHTQADTRPPVYDYALRRFPVHATPFLRMLTSLCGQVPVLRAPYQVERPGLAGLGWAGLKGRQQKTWPVHLAGSLCQGCQRP